MYNNIKKLATGHGLILRPNEKSSVLIEPTTFAKFQEQELTNPQSIVGGTAYFTNDELISMLNNGKAFELSNEELLRLTEETSRISLLSVTTDAIGRFSYFADKQIWAVN